ncbi:MAG: DUF1501 domain-containing protein [Isosphaera sp.]|nr:DUF1501 domain-containing protein [Isosphaera sp.]
MSDRLPLSRRDWLAHAGLGLLGTSVSGWLPRLAAAAPAAPPGRAKSCILLWMAGGPAHMETFDPKPDAPDGYRGEYQPIATKVPGLRFAEKLPLLAGRADRLAVLRGMTHTDSNHTTAPTLMHASHAKTPALNPPSVGAVVSAELGRADAGLPNFVTVYGGYGGPGFTEPPAAGYLGPRHMPLVIPDPTRELKDFQPPVEPGVYDPRVELLRAQEEAFLKENPSPLGEAHRTAYAQAVGLLKSGKLKAFDLSAEPEKVKAAYGCGRGPVRHQNEPTLHPVKFAEGCVLARRLVEAGVPFVEVVLPWWDTHEDHWFIMPELCGIVDRAMGALLDDLNDRGLLDSTLVVWMGEFGRTPQLGKAGPPRFRGPGRGHYPKAFSAVLAGGGLKTGQAVGRTDKAGGTVEDRATTPGDLVATICAATGIDPTREYDTRTGKPIPDDLKGTNVNGARPARAASGKPVAEVLG